MSVRYPLQMHLLQFALLQLCVVSPDAGGAKRAAALADSLDSSIAIFSKQRKADQAGVVQKMILTGDVKGKVCILIDDMVTPSPTHHSLPYSNVDVMAMPMAC